MPPRTDGFSLQSTATPTPIIFVTVPWIPDIATVGLPSQGGDLGEQPECPVATTLGSPDEALPLSPVGVTLSSPSDATALCPTEATVQSPSEAPLGNPVEATPSCTAVTTHVGPLEATFSCVAEAPIQPLFLIGQTTERPKSKTRRKLRPGRFGRLSPSGSCSIVGQSVSFRSGDFSSNPTTDSEAEVAISQPPEYVAKPSVSNTITQLCKDVRNVLVQPPLWGLVPPTHQSVPTEPSECTETEKLQSSEHIDTKKLQPSSESVVIEESKPSKSSAADLVAQPSKCAEMKKSESQGEIKVKKSQPATPFIWMIPSVTEPHTLATSQPSRGFSPSDSPPSYESTFPNSAATQWPSSNRAGQPMFSFNFPYQNDVTMVDAPTFDFPKRNEEVLVNKPTSTSNFDFSKRTDGPLVNEQVFNFPRRNKEVLVNEPAFNFPKRNDNEFAYEPMFNFPKTTERENNLHATFDFPNRTKVSSVNKHMFNFPNRAQNELVNKPTFSFPNTHTFNFATNRSEDFLGNNHTFNFPNRTKDSLVNKHTFNFPNKAQDELVNKQTFSFSNKHTFNFPNKPVNSIGSQRTPNVFLSNTNKEAFGEKKNLRHPKGAEISFGNVPYRNKTSCVNASNYNTDFSFQPKVSTPNAAFHRNFNFPQTVSYVPLSTAAAGSHGNRFSFKPNISTATCPLASAANSYPMFPHTSLTTKSASSVSHRSSSRFTIKPKYTLSSVRRVSFSDKVSYGSPVASKPRDALLTLSTEAGFSRKTADVGQPPVVVSIDQQVASQPCVRINTSNLVIQITNDMVKVVINPQ